jgi:FKBP-type peptidyl-prolyl cis-trans isomerase FkpA
MKFKNTKRKCPVLLLVSCLYFIAACTSQYKKADGGNEYKIISESNDEKLRYGSFIEFHLKQYYTEDKSDTLLGDTREYMPRFEAFDSSAIPPEYLGILNKAAKGDSIVIRMSVDSAYRLNKHLMPSYMGKGGFTYTTIKILDVFKTRYQADSIERNEFKKNELKIYEKQFGKVEKEIEKNKAQIEADSKIIKVYLDKNHIKYVRGKWGTFINIHDTGSGEKIRYNNVVAVNYTGKIFETGAIFNSNLDTKLDDRGPYEVTMSKVGSVMPGWTDALMELNNGAKATIYIPSSLAYGIKGFLPKIKPNENIVFDIEVIKMITELQAMEIVSKNRQRAEEAERKNNNQNLKKIIPFGGN